MHLSIPLRLLGPISLAASLAVTGCAKNDKGHHGHDHAKNADHVHGDNGEVVYLDKPASPGLTGAATDMAQAATTFLAALDDDQRAKASFDFASEERVNWHFVPRERKGLPLKAMKPEQRVLATALLKSGLSAKGFVTSTAIQNLESVLAELEKDPVKRDPEQYFFSVFGKPEAAGTWGWRFEGHHQSLNFTLVEGKAISATPNFMGTNPHEIRSGKLKGTRVLAAEEDKGRALVMTLSDEQKKQAVISADAPKDIVSGTGRTAQIEGHLGLAFADMNDSQKQQLIDLLELYAHRLRDELAAHDLESIRAAGMDKVKFAWAGSFEKNQGHYYRIHGPTFLVEYDNTQNDANHVHTVWRDLRGRDFGDDLLKGHYDAAKGDKAHGHDAAK